MTNQLTSPISNANAFGKLFGQVVLLLLGAPPVVGGVVMASSVVGTINAFEERIAKGGKANGCA